MIPCPSDCYVLARLLAGQHVNGELAQVSEAWRPAVDYLVELRSDARGAAFEAMCAAPGIDHDAVLKAVAQIDPTGPVPEARVLRRSAHLGDLAVSSSSTRFAWPFYIVRGHFNLLSSDPKVGKTHIMLDLARRLYFREPWPDGHDPTFPAGTVTLWVCGDRHQDELRERATAFGLPGEAVKLNSLPDNPYGGWDLDEQANIDLMRDLIISERPGLVFIDTVWRATRRQLRREEEVNALLNPLVTIAQDTDTAIIGAMHLSKDGDTLGRRLEGLARAILKLYRPDPEGQPNRRKLTVIGNFREPPPLGLTMGDTGCEYDSEPPSEPATNKGGRPAAECIKAQEFIVKHLKERNDRKGIDLINEWTQLMGEAKGTIFNARAALVSAGRLTVDDSKKPQIWHLADTGSETVKNPVSDRF